MLLNLYCVLLNMVSFCDMRFGLCIPASAPQAKGAGASKAQSNTAAKKRPPVRVDAEISASGACVWPRNFVSIYFCCSSLCLLSRRCSIDGLTRTETARWRPQCLCFDIKNRSDRHFCSPHVCVFSYFLSLLSLTVTIGITSAARCRRAQGDRARRRFNAEFRRRRRSAAGRRTRAHRFGVGSG